MRPFRALDISPIADHCTTGQYSAAQDGNVERNTGAGAEEPDAAIHSKESKEEGEISESSYSVSNHDYEHLEAAGTTALSEHIEDEWRELGKNCNIARDFPERIGRLRLLPKRPRLRQPGWEEAAVQEVLKEEQARFRIAWNAIIVQMQIRHRPDELITRVREYVDKVVELNDRQYWPMWPPGDFRNQHRNYLPPEVISAVLGYEPMQLSSGGHWAFMHVLGTGGFGTASLVAHVDDHGNMDEVGETCLWKTKTHH